MAKKLELNLLEEFEGLLCDLSCYIKNKKIISEEFETRKKDLISYMKTQNFKTELIRNFERRYKNILDCKKILRYY